MIIDAILPELIVISIVGGTGIIFAYLRKKFNCQNQIQSQINQLTYKLDAMMQIYKMILQDTHPENMKEFERLLKLVETKQKY